MRHFIRHCPEKNEKVSEKENQESASFCQSSEEEIHRKEELFRHFTPEFALHVSDGKEIGTKWLIDSACSKHITGDKKDLTKYKKYRDTDKDKADRYVELADGSESRRSG